MGPFVDTYASILLARRKLDAGTRQVTIFLIGLIVVGSIMHL